MLKEYTLKVTCEMAGETEASCDELMNDAVDIISTLLVSTPEITHEEVVQPDEVERE